MDTNTQMMVDQPNQLILPKKSENKMLAMLNMTTLTAQINRSGGTIGIQYFDDPIKDYQTNSINCVILTGEASRALYYREFSATQKTSPACSSIDMVFGTLNPKEDIPDVISQGFTEDMSCLNCRYRTQNNFLYKNRYIRCNQALWITLFFHNQQIWAPYRLKVTGKSLKALSMYILYLESQNKQVKDVITHIQVISEDELFPRLVFKENGVIPQESVAKLQLANTKS